MLFKKILVPYDNSKASQDALEKAIELTKLTDTSRLYILHVVPELPLLYLFDRPVRTRQEKANDGRLLQAFPRRIVGKCKMMLQHIEELL